MALQCKDFARTMHADLDQTTFAGGFRVTTCPNCGLAHDASCRFCRACGHTLTNVAPPLRSVAAPVWSSAAAPAPPSGPSGSFPLAASIPVVQPASAPLAKVASRAHALLIALSVTAGLLLALFVFWIGVGGGAYYFWRDRTMLDGFIALTGIALAVALLIWLGRASLRWLLAGILCLAVALPVYIYKERRGAISRRTGRPLSRFPGLAVNASLVGAGILALTIAAFVAVRHGGESTHDVVVAQTAPFGALGRYALSCACDATGTQHFDVVVNSAGLSSRIGSARAAGEFVVITLKITNTGNQSTTFPFWGAYGGLVDEDGNHFDAIRLTDRAGRTFTQDYDASEAFWYMNPSARWPSDRLQPGIAYTFGLIFDVPVDDPGLVVNIGAATTLTLPELKPAANNDAL